MASGHHLDRSKLVESEYFWRDHQIWLQQCGYMLRPRFRPGWNASWIQKSIHYAGCEDAEFLRVRCPSVIDLIT